MEQAKGILLLGINAKYIHTNLALYSLRQYAIKAALGPTLGRRKPLGQVKI